MNELYVLVDLKENMIISPIMELPLNFGNISGVKFLSDEKLADLTWAGEKNLGWRKVTDPTLESVTVPDDWLSFQIANLKQLISDAREEKENEILTFGSKKVRMNERVKSSLTFKLVGSFNDTDTLIWKFMNGTFEITYAELKKLYTFIDTYTQECFNIEHEFSTILDTIEDKNILLNVNLNLNWPSTYYEKVSRNNSR